MLLSMTGYGDARRQNDAAAVFVEVRAVNNRYLKVNVRCPDALVAFEHRIDRIVRQRVRRGTVSVALNVRRQNSDAAHTICHPVLEAYWRQLVEVAETTGVPRPASAAELLQLPGVVIERDQDAQSADGDWPLVDEALTAAFTQFETFRRAEGESMHSDLKEQAGVISEQVDRVVELAPQVVLEYRDRMLDRVRELLNQAESTIDATHVLRDVSIFADRCDINEEITRLRSHLQQFGNFLDSETSQGRKLEFLGQEIFREVNTIGSKANNVAIAHCVVDMKAAVEKIREILQNVE